ncbi:uncharacterized protein DS421_5g137900 [Arachis hypogaea]|nr:uncharacterized protein DS421_5g137900 [Arachis hypogaea]
MAETLLVVAEEVLVSFGPILELARLRQDAFIGYLLIHLNNRGHQGGVVSELPYPGKRLEGFRRHSILGVLLRPFSIVGLTSRMIGGLPLVGCHHLANFLVIDVLSRHILDFLHCLHRFGGEVFPEVFNQQTIC